MARLAKCKANAAPALPPTHSNTLVPSSVPKLPRTTAYILPPPEGPHSQEVQNPVTLQPYLPFSSFLLKLTLRGSGTLKQIPLQDGSACIAHRGAGCPLVGPCAFPDLEIFDCQIFIVFTTARGVMRKRFTMAWWLMLPMVAMVSVRLGFTYYGIA
ncbi:hypothetical protein JX266_003623 [Neoarthrinium moseri]|nr:hypothetical protein JX266_003623 [Neoarthrinium moseri]